jgi:hypothetical protein
METAYRGSALLLQRFLEKPPASPEPSAPVQ